MATDKKSYRTFFRPSVKSTRYYSRVPGPAFLRFDYLFELHLPELKLVEHHKTLLLLWADVICTGLLGCNFKSVGIHNHLGFATFYHEY